MRSMTKKPRKTSLLVVLCSLLLAAGGGPACHDRAPEMRQGESAANEKAVTERIADADALYSQRKDLAKVRSGIVALRQARITDEGNYEAAWKLAKFDYYLGSHATDD